MAKKGTYAAYQQSTPVRADFGDAMQQFAGQMIDINARKQALAQQRRKEQVELSRELDREFDALEPIITGVQSVDEINYRAFQNASRQLGSIGRQIMENPQLELDPNLKMKRANLRNSPKMLKALETQMMNRYKTLEEGLANGTLSRENENMMKEMEAFFGVKGPNGKMTPNYSIEFDEKTGEMITYGITQDGRKFKKGVVEVLNGYEWGEPIATTDINKYVSESVKAMGKSQELVNMKNGVAVRQQWDANKEDTQRKILQKQLYDETGEASDEARSLWVDGLNNDPGSEVDVQALEEELLNRMRAQYDETINSWSRNPVTKTGDGDKKAKEIQEIHSRINIMIDPQSNEPIKRINRVSDTGADGEAFAFNIPPTEVSIGGSGKVTFNSLFMDPLTGEIGARGVEKSGKIPTPQQDIAYADGGPLESFEDFYTFKGEEVNMLANELYFNDALELRNFLYSKMPQTTNQVHQSTSGSKYKVKR